MNGNTLQIETSFGMVRYGTDEAGNRTLFLQDEETDWLQSTPHDSGAAVQIIVIDSSDGSVAGVKRFDRSLSVYRE